MNSVVISISDIERMTVLSGKGHKVESNGVPLWVWPTANPFDHYHSVTSVAVNDSATNDTRVATRCDLSLSVASIRKLIETGSHEVWTPFGTLTLLTNPEPTP